MKLLTMASGVVSLFGCTATAEQIDERADVHKSSGASAPAGGRAEENTPPPLNELKPRYVALLDGEGAVVIEFSEPASPTQHRLSDSSSLPSWSPDGQRLVWRQDKDTERSLLLGRAATLTVEASALVEPGVSASSTAWFDDGRVAVRRSPDNRIYDWLGEGSPDFPALVFGFSGQDFSAPLRGWLVDSGDSSWPYVFERAEKDPVVLPWSSQLITAPDLSRLVVVNPMEGMTLGEGAFIAHVPDSDPMVPPCDIAEICDFAKGRPEVKGVRFPRAGGTLMAVQWPDVDSLSGDRLGAHELYFTRVDDLNLRAHPPGELRLQPNSLDSDSMWALSSEDNLLYVVPSGFGTEEASFSVAQQDLGQHPGVVSASADRVLFAANGIAIRLTPNDDHNSVVVEWFAGGEKGISNFTALRKTDGAWNTHALLADVRLGFTNPVQHSSTQDAILVSLSLECAQRSVTVLCEDDWQPSWESGALNGFTLFGFDSEASDYRITATGNGAATFTPDGEGLLIWDSEGLYYAPLSAPEQRYLLAKVPLGGDYWGDISIPRAWPEE